MATLGIGQGENQRRRLPKLIPPNPGGGSSDDTPRTTTGDESARQRRRDRQQSARQQTPDGRETISSPSIKELPLPPRSNQSEERDTTKRRKARRRVKSSSQLEQEPSLLRGLEDEVIVEKSKRSNEFVLPDLLLSSTYAGNTASKSAPTPRIYVENKKTFSSVNKDAATVRIGNRSGQSPYTLGHDDSYTFQQQTAEVLKRYTVHVAKQTHAAFQKFFLFIHGINSGYALWVCVFSFVFISGEGSEFFTIYRTIALITHLLFYLFLAICMVDVLDRIDPVKFNRTVLLQSITAQNAAPALIFYMVAMVTNLVMMKTEDQLRMTLYNSDVNGTISSINDIATNQGDLWKNLTAVRAAFSVVGWFIVSIHAKNDRLSTMIKNTEEKAFYEELKIEQNTVPLVAGMNSA
ncbi:unnamed protein product [Adineta steineri]|uniref:Transmembrane protein 237 n=1 Tax=Adineta steineri TaxID=433720 RepID=A0A818JJ33_9BILA|nr:unnamed protein product [Adineta steineri]CAF0857428.1 unnamed protein product [Adineta steineri]CAF0896418.1 unnamed protein product [Adineta steineri]CAF0952055.1 unnamed protein product [Adineta steineri]CAF3489710.1 unnamed protein product [Adineta steineri]